MRHFAGLIKAVSKPNFPQSPQRFLLIVIPTCYQDTDFVRWLDSLVAIIPNAIFAKLDSDSV
jgi:hypothetical protein